MINLENLLAVKFQVPKPLRDPDLNQMRRMRSAGKLIVQRKRDGGRYLVAVTSTGVKIYPRTLTGSVTKSFPKVVEAFESFQLPVGTVLDCEVTLTNGKDDFGRVQSICRSGWDKAVWFQTHTPVVFNIFDVLWIAGDSMLEHPYSVRYQTIQAFRGRHSMVDAVQDLQGSLDDCMDLAKAEGWEGLVFWATDGTTAIGYGTTCPRMNCWKWKPSKEEDFIATGFELGTGHMSSWVGALNLVEYKAGKPVSVGGVGTGMTEALRAEMVNWTFPCVVEVLYDERTPTGKLRFPRFLRRRDDKPLEEVMGA